MKRDGKAKAFAEYMGTKAGFKKFEIREGKQRLIVPPNIGDHHVNRLLAKDILERMKRE